MEDTKKKQGLVTLGLNNYCVQALTSLAWFDPALAVPNWFRDRFGSGLKTPKFVKAKPVKAKIESMSIPELRAYIPPSNPRPGPCPYFVVWNVDKGLGDLHLFFLILFV